VDTLLQDLRGATRLLVKAPSFAAISILTLALGIGANTALFTVVNGVLLNPLPHPRSSDLVALYGKTTAFEKGAIAYPNFIDWEEKNQSFSSIALYKNEDYNFTGQGEGQRVSGYMVSAKFFSTLGVAPLLGRTFRPEDDQLGAAPVVVLGGGFWSRAFGSSPEVFDKTLVLNGTAYTIVGVIPASFTFYGQARDVYTPIGQWSEASFRDRRIVHSSGMVGRLKAGTSLAHARADMEHVADTLALAYPQADTGVGVTLVSLKEDIVGNVQPLLLILLGAVGFLLLIACANVANLLLARSMNRSAEFAVRVALGASHMRVIRQLLTESLLLGVLGGVLGMVLASFGTKAVIRTLPGTLPRATEVSLDSRVFLFTLGVSVLAAILFGLAPALKASRANLQEILKESGRGASGARHRLQGILVAVEMALAFVLLVGAGLMVRSLSALWRVDPGFAPSHALTFSVSLPTSPTSTSAETRARLRQFEAKLEGVAGVEAVSVTLGSRPMIHNSTEAFWIEGQPKPANDNEMSQALFYLASAGFQRAMGITMARGRFIGPEDNEQHPPVIVVDDVFARTYLPHEDPIGKRVNLALFGVQAEIVGVAGHVKQWGLDTDAKSALEAQFYYPIVQLPEKLMPLVATGVAVVLRTKGDPAALMGPIRSAVGELDPREVIYNVQTMDEVVSKSFAARRVSMVLLSAFATIALLLACVGIYGVVSYLVGQRTHEIGVRMALGAQASDIWRVVIGDGLRMALVGVGVGTGAALGMTRLMAHQLFGVGAHDPLTFAAVALLFVGVAVAACYVPARRAMNVDPTVALRYE
jgi:predicted permease